MRPRPKDNRKRNGGHSKMKNMNRINGLLGSRNLEAGRVVDSL